MQNLPQEPGQPMGRCPFHGATAGPSVGSPTAPTGCPVSANAAAFDAFDGPYQLDPAEGLRWARAQEPVFYSPKLGYWVVSRYEDVKAVFRDSLTFSPSIALEKITPNSPEADAILARYDYGMDRALVNEDEAAHMERRRALMLSFTPEELANHEPMVRRLTREYVDRFIDKGGADLVDDMLWEIPLTVALHFLGVPEEDMDTLREYSIAHTVNTWGRPTPDEQIAVAEAVGKFWRFAGQVLDKMRADASGHGWMKYAIRRQKELPEVITDSYLHSMMMAGIVAAHETTAHATANALRLLLQNRDRWEEICADPSLIPNAVEECLRLSGSIVSWRRIATADTRIGGADIPEGAKLLLVMASANHDERHFENPDELDIYRDNTTDHLSFGYGGHQCMGKNLARMEMRIFVDLYGKTEGGRLDLGAVVAAAQEDAEIYACGPDRLPAALEQCVRDRPERLHIEHFSSAGAQLDPDEENPFEVELKDSQLSISVPADQTLLQALHATGIDVPCDCEEGLCGSCEVPVVAGDVDHRDKVLSAAERAAGGRMMACCSRPLAVPSERPHRQGGRRLPFGARRLVEPGVMAGSRALRARAPPRQTW